MFGNPNPKFPESSTYLSHAMAQLPYEQREVVILHLRAAMTFRQIARMQDLSLNTVKRRCVLQ
ncbi:RNA polymerase sigma factor [Planctomycetota bacterium]